MGRASVAQPQRAAVHRRGEGDWRESGAQPRPSPRADPARPARRDGHVHSCGCCAHRGLSQLSWRGNAAHHPKLGQHHGRGRGFISKAMWIIFFPGLVLGIAVTAINLAGTDSATCSTRSWPAHVARRSGVSHWRIARHKSGRHRPHSLPRARKNVTLARHPFPALPHPTPRTSHLFHTPAPFSPPIRPNSAIFAPLL